MLTRNPYGALATVVGFDWGDLANVGKAAGKVAGGIVNVYAPGAGTALSDVATEGISQAQSQQQKDKAAAEGQQALQAAILADGEARAALQQALFSKSDADKAASDAALDAMRTAGAAVPSSLAGQRLAAAKAAVTAALAESQKKAKAAQAVPKNARAQIESSLAKQKLQAAQQIAAMITGGGGGGASPPVPEWQEKAAAEHAQQAETARVEAVTARSHTIAWGVGIAAVLAAAFAAIVALVARRS